MCMYGCPLWREGALRPFSGQLPRLCVCGCPVPLLCRFWARFGGKRSAPLEEDALPSHRVAVRMVLHRRPLDNPLLLRLAWCRPEAPW